MFHSKHEKRFRERFHVNKTISFKNIDTLFSFTKNKKLNFFKFKAQ